ncbi:helix-hairpin-helix protein [Breznakibacter xylanolyticus]|uniref:Helix-hairpin-helix protein n=1 Tax=Breznakibacter xylanolyticus TaxID=990 RepID=A0A2W7NFS4_9BACT|nr:helix-hairpin-helix domain-containing protein [Breznakibacter xylanolyticus]PZX19241.1 helix-hairpin-helix protein [Breznakibacter xylanolyticus]
MTFNKAIFRYFWFSVSIITSTQIIHGQTPAADSRVSEWLETLAEQGIETESSPESETLLQYLTTPMNLNTASKTDLEGFYFLSDKQIENLLFHIHENGAMLSLYELQAVEGMDERTIQLLKSFVTVLPPTDQAVQTKGETYLRCQSVLEQPKGYSTGAYQGTPQKWLGKTKISHGQLQTGLAFEKDAGEPAFNKGIAITDHVAGFIRYEGKTILRQAIVGCYRLSMGQGIAMGTSMSTAFTSDPLTIRRRGQALTGYASGDEINYLQGMAAQLNPCHHLILIPFVSHKTIDGNPGEVSNTITGLSKTGYHRTQTELDRRKNTNEWLGGMSIQYRHEQWRFETGGYHYQLSHTIAPSNILYQQNRFSGDAMQNYWAAYQAIWGKAMLFGEWSLNNTLQTGQSHGITWDIDNKLGLSVRAQHFDNRYHSPYGNAGNRYSEPAGESNATIGVRTMPHRHITIEGWHMLYKSTVPRYQISTPSHGLQTTLRQTWQCNRDFQILLQFKNRSNDKDSNGTHPADAPVTRERQQSYRIQLNYQTGQNWRLSTRIEYCHYHHQTTSEGLLLYQEIQWRHPNNLCQVTLRYAQFNTDDYYSRIYTYEPDVLYGFSIPAFSGKGSRVVLNTRFSPHKNWDLYFRVSRLTDADNTIIGSGHDEIGHPYKHEVKFQLRHTFSRKNKANNTLKM